MSEQCSAFLDWVRVGLPAAHFGLWSCCQCQRQSCLFHWWGIRTLDVLRPYVLSICTYRQTCLSTLGTGSSAPHNGSANVGSGCIFLSTCNYTLADHTHISFPADTLLTGMTAGAHNRCFLLFRLILSSPLANFSVARVFSSHAVGLCSKHFLRGNRRLWATGPGRQQAIISNPHRSSCDQHEAMMRVVSVSVHSLTSYYTIRTNEPLNNNEDPLNRNKKEMPTLLLLCGLWCACVLKLDKKFRKLTQLLIQRQRANVLAPKVRTGHIILWEGKCNNKLKAKGTKTSNPCNSNKTKLKTITQ